MVTTTAISEALERVRAETEKLQAHIVHTSQMSREDRELLFSRGWLQEIIRGWYMLVRPDTSAGDSAAWYANFWDFIRIYLHHRFGEEYCLTAESSLDLHTEKSIVPQQLIVMVKKGAGLRELKYGTSILFYTDKKNLPEEKTNKQGIQVMSLPYALCKVSENYFKNNARDAELALRSIRNADELSRVLIKYNLKTAAGRLVGAYQFLEQNEFAKKIIDNLDLVGLSVTPKNPFERKQPLLSDSHFESPYAGRICAMWEQARQAVIENFPSPPGLPKNRTAYFNNIDDIYQYDAYNSLSIEGYQVTDDLIARVKANKWDPGGEDANERNALAARGYFDAFKKVKQCIERIVNKENAAKVVRENLQIWYQNLFGTSAKAGIIPPEALFGYRNDRVFIRNSIHFPPPKEAVLDAMEAFFDCLENENHPGVNAVLGHYFFVFIHPYMDGNGRLGRFLMNALLAAGGYPWTVIRVKNRSEYISILENTHSDFDLSHFARFISREMNGL